MPTRQQARQIARGRASVATSPFASRIDRATRRSLQRDLVKRHWKAIANENPSVQRSR